MRNSRAAKPITVGNLSSTARQTIRRRLLAWYDRHKRDLPWRRRPGDPYAQLVAEVMLQQTQAATVGPYYERFLIRFPTVDHLAAADLNEVLPLWAGLGYYARARNLHAAARRIVEVYGGTVPRTADQLLTLPGIGRYTAGAVASIVADQRVPVVDGNVARVLARLLALSGDLKKPALNDRLWTVAESLLPQRRCGDFNQALMELGATVCLPRGPTCQSCPIRVYCQAHRRNLTDRIPQVSRRARVASVGLVVAAIKNTDGSMLFIQRPLHGLWAGLWELPSEPGRDRETADRARRRLANRLDGWCTLDPSPIGQVTRLLTHRRMTFRIYLGRPVGRPQANRLGRQPVRWVTPDRADALGISRACTAVLATVVDR